MYKLIETTTNNEVVIGTFNTFSEAENEAIKLYNNYCDYSIYQLINNNKNI